MILTLVGHVCIMQQGSIEEKIYQRQICKQGLNTVVDVKDNCDSGSVQFSLEDLKVSATHSTETGNVQLKVVLRSL